MLIGQNVSKLETILDSTGYDYTITHIRENSEKLKTNYDIYIDNQYGGVKLWEIESVIPSKRSSSGRSRIAIEGEPEYISIIFVRYRHSNMGDLKDFKSYEIPRNDNLVYEKEMGKQLSHFKVECRKKFK